jgi:uncharacterized protein
VGHHPRTSPHRIDRPVVVQRWEDVGMVHWRADRTQVQAVVDPRVEVEEADGSAWVSLVGFRMAGLTVPGVPPVPWASRFAEVNVRTYVTGPHGPAIWFCSLDIPRLPGVAVARAAFAQPYAWARMRMERRGDEVRWWVRRRLPGPGGARTLLGLRQGERTAPDDLDAWLTNRWGAYAVHLGRLTYTPVVHQPWDLHAATPTVLRDELGAAVGLPLGHVERAHLTPSVDGVRFALPRPSAPR